MLKLRIPLSESYDEERNEFVVDSYYDLKLEHSLVSLSKWEQKFEKPFLSNEEKSNEETIWYIKAMSLEETPEEIFEYLNKDHYDQISEYINSKMTATWFRDTPNRPGSREVITSEIIYYWMLSLNIDMECETWHLSRLITLIRVINEKNQPQKKMGRAEMIRERNRLNEQRLGQLNSRG